MSTDDTDNNGKNNGINNGNNGDRATNRNHSDDLESVIKYPCEFPVKAMGKNDAQLEAAVLDIIHRHAPGLKEGAIKTRPSSNGKYLSITITITAQNRAQLEAIYQELTVCERVLMAL